jgi:hypothetical protein
MVQFRDESAGPDQVQQKRGIYTRPHLERPPATRDDLLGPPESRCDLRIFQPLTRLDVRHHRRS